jgi:hypothetical protein
MTKSEYKDSASYIVRKYIREAEKMSENGYKMVPFSEYWEDSANLLFPEGLSTFQIRKLKNYMRKEIQFVKNFIL